MGRQCSLEKLVFFAIEGPGGGIRWFGSPLYALIVTNPEPPTQRLQYHLMKEYTLDYSRIPNMI